MFEVDEWQPPAVAPPLTLAEITEDPDQAAAWLAVEAPGPDAVAGLSLLDPGVLSHAGRVDVLVALERHLAWLAGVQAQVLAAMAADDGSEDRWVREEVGCALRLSALTAQRRLAVAETLTGALAETGRALHRGRIGYLHAMTLAEATYPLDPQVATAVQARVLPRAGGQTLAEFKRSVRRAVHTLNPARVEEQRAHAMSERRVCVTAREDGMAELWALLPAEGAAAVMAAVDCLASVTSATDLRTADQRRADALVDLGIAALHDPHLPKAQGMRPSIHVTVAVSTLLGLDEQPGELAGHGPIPASVARHLAADQTGTWRRLLTDPATGHLLDYGHTTYRPPRDLTEYVIARDQTCTFPGCARAAAHCDIDHRIPYNKGGNTTPENLAALCRRHHRLKHEADWKLDRQAEGSYHWTSPTRHTYQSQPPDQPHDASRTQPAESDPDPPPF